MKPWISEELAWLPGKTGKQGQYLWLPAWLHMEDTALTIRNLYRFWLSKSLQNMLTAEFGESVGESLCVFLALVHDIGKLTPVFSSKLLLFLPETQNKLQELGYQISSGMAFLDASKSPHGLSGEAILDSYGCPGWLAGIVAAHHGKPTSEEQEMKLSRQMNSAGTAQNYYGANGRDSSTRTLWESVRREWFEHCLKEAGINDLGKLPVPGTNVQLVLSGLLIMADWIASNTLYYPLIPCDENGKETDLQKRAEEGWKRLGLAGPWCCKKIQFNDNYFQKRFGFYPNTVQQKTIKAASEAIKPGIFILEAQMGIGKTEAALVAAEVLAARKQSGGLFFGLPTQATANGIFPRLVHWAGQHEEEETLSIRLAHGSAELNETYQSLFSGHGETEEDASEPLIVHPWFEGNKQALLADFVIGTIDQLLLAALKQRHVMMRHLGIAGKVIIVDECHAYDAYMNGYLDRALEWLGRYDAPVVILSATLPFKRREELVNAYLGFKKGKLEGEWRTCRSYPLLTWTDGDKVQQSVIQVDTPKRNVRISHLDDEELPAILVEKLRNGGCVGVILNTVRRAQTLWKRLKEVFPDKRILLFHAQVTFPDRAVKEKDLIASVGKASIPETRNGLIVVGTQVLEQSLDVDFDLLVTDLCPMDLLLQRIGRLHRHNGRIRPEQLREAECIVLNAMGNLEPGARKIYGDWLLHRTAILLPERISIPDDISDLVQNTYEDVLAGDLGTEERVMWNDYQEKIKDKATRAKNFQIRKPKTGGTLTGFLDMSLSGGQHVEAAVRDGEESITVLVMVKQDNGRIGFLPWISDDTYSSDHVPDDEACLKIAKQQIRLPAIICGLYWRQTEQVIEHLEKTTLYELGEWKQSRWLNGELFLLLDSTLQAEVCGWKIKYDRELGLTYEKEVPDGERQRV